MGDVGLDNVVMNFGSWLEKELEARDWTVHHFAMLAGVPQSTIQRIIRERRNPRIDTAEKIQRAVGARYPGEEIEVYDPAAGSGVFPPHVAEKVAEYSAKDIEVVLAGNPALGPADIEAIMLIVEGKERQLREAEKKRKKK